MKLRHMDTNSPFKLSLLKEKKKLWAISDAFLC